MFADFSLVFNKVQPHILMERLASYFCLPDQVLMLLNLGVVYCLMYAVELFQRTGLLCSFLMTLSFNLFFKAKSLNMVLSIILT